MGCLVCFPGPPANSADASWQCARVWTCTLPGAMTTAPPPAPDHGDPPPLLAWLALVIVLAATGLELTTILQAQLAGAEVAIERLFTPAALGLVTLQVVIAGGLAMICQQLTDGTWLTLGSWEVFRSRDAALRAVVLGIALFVLLSFLLPSLLISIWPSLHQAHPNILAGAIPDLQTLLWGLPVAVIGGGVREELWRVVWLRAFERVGGQTGLLIGFASSVVLFGAVHWYQGPVAVGITAVMGLLLGWRWMVRRDLSELIVMHGLHNACTLVLVWLMPHAGAP